MARLRQLAGAFGALLVMLAIVVGIPALLIRAVGNPFPSWSTITDFEEIRRQFTQNATDIDQFIISVLAIFIWILWAQLVMALLVEIVAYRRGTAARRTRTVPGLQGFAGKLVGAVALLSSLSTGPVGLAATAAIPDIGIDQGYQPERFELRSTTSGNESPELVLGVVDPSTSEEQATSTIELDRAATWWQLAEDVYGDGLQWQDLLELNLGRTMPDGTVIDEDVEFLKAGWTIEVPASEEDEGGDDQADGTAADEVAAPALAGAAGSSAAPSAPDGSSSAPSAEATSLPATEIEVAKGDHFWKLAEDRLAEAWGRAPTDAEILPYWQDVVAANSPVPSGDADLIHPGDVYAFPATPSDPLAPAASAPAADFTGLVLPDPSAETVRMSEPGPPPPAANVRPGDDRLAPATAPASATPAPGDGDGPDPQEATTVRSEDAPPPPAAVPASSGGDDPPMPADAAQNGAGPDPQPGSPAPPVVPLGSGNGDPATLPPQTGQAPDPKSVAPTVIAQPSRVDTVPDPAADPGHQPVGSGGPEANAGLPFAAISGSSLLVTGAWSRVRTGRERQIAERPGGQQPVASRSSIVDAETALAMAAHANRSKHELERATVIEIAARALSAAVSSEHFGDIATLSFSDRGVGVRLLGPSPSPLGDLYTNGEAGTWFLPVDAAQLGKLRSATAPLAVGVPALVGLGTTGDREVFLNLEDMPEVSLRGDREHVLAMMRTLAVELAVSPLAAGVQVVCIGFGSELAADFERINYRPELARALDELDFGADAVANALLGGTPLQYRADGSDPADVAPMVVFDLSAGSEGDRRRLHQIARRSAGGVSAVCGYDVPTSLPITVTSHQVMVPGDLDLQLRQATLTVDEIELLADLVSDARRRTYEVSDVASVAHVLSDLDQAPLPADPPQPMASPSGVRIDVLGSVRCQDADLDAAQLELVSLLLAFGGSANAEQIEGAMFHGSAVPEGTVSALAESTASALGSTDGGGEPTQIEPRLRLDTATGTYRLADVTSDLDELTAIGETVAAGEVSGVKALRQLDRAAQLVRGPAYGGIGEAFWWALRNRDRAEATVQIDDMCAEVARGYRSIGQHVRARWALRQGLRACPGSVAMYAELLRCASADGDEMDEVWSEVEAVFSPPPAELEELFGELARGRQFVQF